MNINEWVKKVGVFPDDSLRIEILDLLKQETLKEKEKQGAGDTQLMKLYCVQLFNIGRVDDVISIWSAKNSSSDSDFAIEIQLLCGAGLSQTKDFLLKTKSKQSLLIFQDITKSEQDEDFFEFDVEVEKEWYFNYYSKI